MFLTLFQNYLNKYAFKSVTHDELFQSWIEVSERECD